MMCDCVLLMLLACVLFLFTRLRVLFAIYGVMLYALFLCVWFMLRVVGVVLMYLCALCVTYCVLYRTVLVSIA